MNKLFLKTCDDEAAPLRKPKLATRANPVFEEEATFDESNKPDPVTPNSRPPETDETPTGSLHGSIFRFTAATCSVF